jgi:hypothetical protein
MQELELTPRAFARLCYAIVTISALMGAAAVAWEVWNG